MKIKLFIYLSVTLLFSLLIYIAFGKSLQFSLFGDDWFMFYVIDKHYGPGNQFPFFSLSGYTQPWGVMNLCLIIIRHFFEYASYGYFLVSMGLRVLTAFAGYIFLSKFIKSKAAALIGSLFIAIGYSGIESSNYVLHMNVYLVTLFLFISLTFLIGSFKGTYWKFAIGCVLFAVSLAVNPIRSHGLLPFVLFFDFIFAVAIAQATLKTTLIRQICLSLSALAVYRMGFFGEVHATNIINLTVITRMFQTGDYTFISAFITNLGKAFLPDLFTPNLGSITLLIGANWYKWFIAIGLIVESIIFFIFSSITIQKLKNYLFILLILITNFTLTFFVFKQFPHDQGMYLILINTFIGIFFITFLIWAIYILFISKLEKKNIEWVGMASGPILILTSFIVPLVFNPGAIMGSDGRYLTLSLAGVAITLSSLLVIASKINIRVAFLTTVILLTMLTFNIKNDRKYMNNLYATRNVAVTDLMWSKLFRYLPREYPNKLLVFYFDDKENPGLANNTILFGFPPRMALEYKIKDASLIPTFTNIYTEVVSTVTDGKAFLRLGYPQEKISLNQVFAFKFTKNGDLLDITQEIRKSIIKQK
ncbi:MAG: hypothetical protein AAB535_00330 [Patescibacteria group bacterium]